MRAALTALALAAAACAGAPATETTTTATSPAATAPVAATLPPNDVLSPGGCLDGISPDLLPVAGSFENMNEADLLMMSEVWSYLFAHCSYDDLAYYSREEITGEEYREGREGIARLCALNAQTAGMEAFWDEEDEEMAREMEEAREAAEEMANGMLCSSVADAEVAELWPEWPPGYEEAS